MEHETQAVTFLVPVVTDITRVPHAETVWSEFHRRLRLEFPTNLILRRTQLATGAYRSADGSWVGDDSLCYVVFLERIDLPRLHCLLEWAHDAFAQRGGIYLEMAGEVTFVKPHVRI